MYTILPALIAVALVACTNPKTHYEQASFDVLFWNGGKHYTVATIQENNQPTFWDIPFDPSGIYRVAKDIPDSQDKWYECFYKETIWGSRTDTECIIHMNSEQILIQPRRQPGYF